MGSLNDFKASSKSKTELKNRYLDNKDEGIKLLAKLISAQNSNNKVEMLLYELEIMVKNEFLALTERDKCPGSAETYANLQKSFEDLVEIVNFPKLENKFTIAIGGQFSSGKSKFLNKIMNTKKLLPTDTLATTSIPTYILAGNKDSVFALNNYQSKVEIDNEALHAISHAFKAQYNLSLSHILKMITIERESFKWKNISFLDTPGYSKADSIKSRFDNTDENIAREHLRTADYLIWLTDIQNGTVPQEDINFIQSLQFDEPILFILNKADKKIEKQIEDVIQIAKKDLKKNEIKHYDVIGYSALRNIEYSKNGKVLEKFINEIELKTAGTSIIKSFEAIFDDYMNFHKSEAEFLRVSRKTINDAFFEAFKEENKADKLKSLTRKQQKQISSIVKSENDFKNLKRKIDSTIKNIFKELDIRIIEGYSIKKRKRSLQKIQTYKFNAMVQIQDKTKLSLLNDFKKIPGEITKVKAIGVTIEILHKKISLGEVFIMANEIKKKTNNTPQELFSVSDGVLVDYLGNKKAVIEYKKEI